MDTSRIVVVNESRGVNVGDLVPGGGDATGEIPKINNLLRSGVGSPDLGLTGTERRALLTFTKPANRSAIFENNTTIHAAELEKREERTVGN